MDFEKLIQVFCCLVLEVGDKIMEIYNLLEFEVKIKSDESLVIEVDEVVDVLILVGLWVEFFDLVLVIEEQVDSYD